jgi:hypothetical protein
LANEATLREQTLALFEEQPFFALFAAIARGSAVSRVFVDPPFPHIFRQRFEHADSFLECTRNELEDEEEIHGHTQCGDDEEK